MTIIASPQMNEDEARRLTERIRAIAVTAKEQLEKLQHLLSEARDTEAWRALGYQSWTHYLSDVMGDQPLRLPRDERQQIVGYLAGEGMSTRAIAPIVGAGHVTVSRDLARVSDETRETAEGFVTDQADLDAAPELPDEGAATPRDSGEAESSGAGELSSLSAPARSVTGLDGKTYSRPEPQTPKRRSLVDDARDAGQELRKATERLARIADDDRLARNKNEVAAHLRHHLDQAIKVCQDLDRTLNN